MHITTEFCGTKHFYIEQWPMNMLKLCMECVQHQRNTKPFSNTKRRQRQTHALDWMKKNAQKEKAKIEHTDELFVYLGKSIFIKRLWATNSNTTKTPSRQICLSSLPSSLVLASRSFSFSAIFFVPSVLFDIYFSSSSFVLNLHLWPNKTQWFFSFTIFSFIVFFNAS